MHAQLHCHAGRHVTTSQAARPLWLMSTLRLAGAVLTASAALVIASEIGVDLSRAWDWALPVLVTAAIILIVEEIVIRVRRQLEAVKKPIAELTAYVQQLVDSDGHDDG